MSRARLRFPANCIDLRWALLLWSVVVLTAVVAAPLAASAGRSEGFALYEAFHSLCHQQPQRSWSLAGQPMAVCVRCFGVYVGILIGALSAAGVSRRTLATALALMAASWAVEFFGLARIPEGVRFVTGVLAGVGAAAFVVQRG